jgi:hypothetical protein
MNGITRQSVTVADRQNVDIDGLRDRIVAVYADNPLWEKLSMAQKLRALVEEGLNASEAKQTNFVNSPPQKPPNS